MSRFLNQYRPRAAPGPCSSYPAPGRLPNPASNKWLAAAATCRCPIKSVVMVDGPVDQRAKSSRILGFLVCNPQRAIKSFILNDGVFAVGALLQDNNDQRAQLPPQARKYATPSAVAT